MVIVDLRHALDFEADPETIPGAFRMDAKELREKNDKLPRDRQIILYCTCPNEATSAQLAILLRKQGIQHIRPLQGGLDAWREHGYPVHNATLTQISGFRQRLPLPEGRHRKAQFAVSRPLERKFSFQRYNRGKTIPLCA